MKAREALNLLWDSPELDEAIKREWLEAVEKGIAEAEEVIAWYAELGYDRENYDVAWRAREYLEEHSEVPST